MICTLWNYFVYTLAFLAFIAITSYVVPVFLAAFVWKEPNLKQRYKASWALVSGGSSGIGRAIVEKLAQQGLNVVVVALEDNVLEKTMSELRVLYPKVEFRVAGVNLGRHDHEYDYMHLIAEVTDDIDVSLIFNNAGYLVLKGFVRADMKSQLTNLECNVTSHLRVTHHFMSKMVSKGLRGCITFTSSQAAFFPAPSSALYGSGKSFLSAFASSLAIEAEPYGIDVTCLMPGPMNTNFTKGLPELDALKFFYSISSSPTEVADLLFKSIGRLAWRDASLYTVFTRLVVKFIDMNVLVWAIAYGQKYTSDYRNHPELR